MSGKDIADTVLQLLAILISWPVIILVVILLLRRHLPDLMDILAKRVTKAPGGFEFMQELRGEVKNIATKVERIEESISFLPSAALTPDLQEKLNSAFSSYSEYLQNLGFKFPEGKPHVLVDPKVKDNAFFDQSENLIVIGEPLASDKDVAFREYTHYVLGSLNTTTYNEWSEVYRAIESGLADYFPCSFNNNPLFSEIAAGGALKKFVNKPYIRDLGNDRKFTEVSPNASPQDVGEIWGGAFWEMRRLLGQATADKLLFSTWVALQPSDTRENEPVGFVRKLLDMVPSSTDRNHVRQIQAIFERRGLKF